MQPGELGRAATSMRPVPSLLCYSGIRRGAELLRRRAAAMRIRWPSCREPLLSPQTGTAKECRPRWLRAPPQAPPRRPNGTDCVQRVARAPENLIASSCLCPRCSISCKQQQPSSLRLPRSRQIRNWSSIKALRLTIGRISSVERYGGHYTLGMIRRTPRTPSACQTRLRLLFGGPQVVL